MVTDRYADLRAALDADPKDDKWMCVKYGPKTLGVGISGGPALFMVREGSYTDIEDARDIVGNLLTVRNCARALLADYDEASARAFYETSVAQAAIEQVKTLEAERDRLRNAAQMLADWAEHEVGAEPDLTPGLAEVRAALAQGAPDAD